ncbi:MAG: acyl-CoA dehydrogenase, partial [Acidimicrobiia bacterium]|nr:acyl-CoA dehydrogenase [Acidimicrobiia bacterium]
EEQKQQILPEVAAGEHRLAVAQLEPSGSWGPDGIALEAAADGDDLVLSGTKSYVIDGHTADSIVVAARTGGGEGPGGISLVLVPGDADGLERRRVETMDQTRKQAELVFSDVRVPASAILGERDGGWAPLQETLERAVVAVAFEQVGGAQACLDMSVAYAKVRVQFGRPIGSFQAIKHKCADMLVQVESAKSAAYYAGWAAAEDPDELHVVGPLAKSFCSEAYFFCAAENIQVHGGIGFTWEHDAHLFFKRAKTDELLFGTPAEHRAVLADRIGL